MPVWQRRLSRRMVIEAMPIQDVIDLAEFLASTSAQFSRFVSGPKSVGGPIEIAAITKHERFRWIRRKYYYSRKINPEGDL